MRPIALLTGLAAMLSCAASTSNTSGDVLVISGQGNNIRINTTQLNAHLETAFGLSFAQLRNGVLPTTLSYTFDPTTGITGTVSWKPNETDVFSAMGIKVLNEIMDQSNGPVAGDMATLGGASTQSHHIDCAKCFKEAMRWIWFPPVFWAKFVICASQGCNA